MKYGWKPDLPDARDHMLKALRVPGGLPSSVDLRNGCPAVYDQGELGSCTANAIGAAVEFDLLKQGLKDFAPSRLQIYYCERVIEHSVGEDAGAEIRDGIKVVHKTGAAPENLWPYDVTKFAKRPPKPVFAAAAKTRVATYQRLVPTLNMIKACLAAGFPFVFGFSVYESFESDRVARTGKMPVPKPGEQLLGGHAVMAAGYSDAKKAVLVRNSWGPDWGIKGYFWMPYEVITNTNMADDFWTIRMIA